MIYDFADRAIKDMNRRNLRAFDKLKLLNFDEMNILHTVTSTYKNSVKLAKSHYKAIFLNAFLDAIEEVGRKNADREDSVLNDWLLDMLEDYDALTHYRFNEETERKTARTAEALIATKVDSREVERALRLWTLQVGAYADRSVLDGRLEAFREAGIKKVMWITQDDNKVCVNCDALDKKIFPIDQVPPRQHYGCRCYLKPVN